MITVNHTNRAGISLLQWISTFPDRFRSSKCPVGYIPRLMSHVNYCGFEASGNGVLQTAFKGDGSEYQWHPARSTAPYFITITCPTAVGIWKVGLRGRNRGTDSPYDWAIEATNTSLDWDTLYTSPTNPIATRRHIDNRYKKFLIDSLGKYRHYRLFCNRAESQRPGISTFQLFVYDD